MSWRASGLALSALLAGAACEQPPAVRPDAADDGGAESGTPERDAAPGVDAGDAASPATFPYDPAGCGYSANVPEGVEPAMDEDAAGASAAPRQIHASWAGPTDTTVAVVWVTGRETLLARLLWGTDEGAVAAADGPGAGVSEARGHTMLFDASTRTHEVHACGLPRATRIFYKVGGPGHWSAVYDVLTGPRVGARTAFRFAVTGDARNEPTIFAEAQRHIRDHAPDFQLFSGDFVVTSSSFDQWNAFFEASDGDFAATEMLARTPFMPTNGNHDALSVSYLAGFALPQDESRGERGQGEQWYSFDYGNAHFIVLDDGAGGDSLAVDQAEWARADLAAVDRDVTPWVFALHHKPTYSCAQRHGSLLSLRTIFQPLFDEFEVDVVLNGHDHDYERSRPIRGFDGDTTNGLLAQEGPNGEPVDGSGTIYLVAAGAGAPLYGVDVCYHTFVAESTRNYVIADVEDRTLRLTAYRLDGSVIDELEVVK